MKDYRDTGLQQKVVEEELDAHLCASRSASQ